MRRAVVPAVFTVVLALGLAAPARAQAPEGCVACHAAEAAAERGTAHARGAVGCVACHGGDASAHEQPAAHAAAAGYRGAIPRAAVPELCGSCHADVRRMTRSGLPTDPLARYRTSRHGEALFGRGDVAVATCGDCHGVHGVLGRGDPRSPVHPSNVPATCGACHADAARMAPRGRSTEQLADWRASVHGALHLAGQPGAPTCATCHDHHGATPPGTAEVGAVCGTCHAVEHEQFARGPHAAPAAAGQMGACVSCHGNHRVEPAADQAYRACGLCHEAGSPAAAAAAELERLFVDGRARHAEVAAAVEAAAREGFDTESERAALEGARTTWVGLRPAAHALDLPALRAGAARAAAACAAVAQSVTDARAAVGWRRLALLPIAAFCLTMSFGVARLRRRLVAARGGPGEAAA